MSDLVAFLLTAVVLAAALAAAYRPLGDYMARVYGTRNHLWVERVIYRLVGVDPDADQRWVVYLRSVLAFSLVSVFALYLLQRVQQWLPLSLDFSPGACRPGLQHGYLIRHEHELAVVLRRGRPWVPGADAGGLGRPELRQCRRRNGGRHRQ